MKFFFKEFFLQDGLGHTVFFETKPMALTGFFVKKTRPFFDHWFLNTLENIHNIFFHKGWKAWKRNEHLFPHSNFIFAEDKTTFSDGEQILNIYVINKKTLLECLKRNEHIFREVLGEDFSVSAFLQKLENEREVRSLINQDECLLGILLGYGYESALAYKHQSVDINQTNYSRVSFHAPENCAISPFAFMGDPHSEQVQSLVKEYEKELKEINIIRQQSKNFLKMLISQISDE